MWIADSGCSRLIPALYTPLNGSLLGAYKVREEHFQPVSLNLGYAFIIGSSTTRNKVEVLQLIRIWDFRNKSYSNDI